MAKKKRGQVASTETLNAVIHGIQTARRDYLEMAGEIDRWPEYWVTTYVAKALWKHFGKSGFATLERQAKSVLTRKPGWQSKNVRGTLKYDINLWKKNESARAIIEIKHQQPRPIVVVSDAKRIAAALRRGKVLGFGAIGYYRDKSGKNPRGALHQYQKDVLDEAENALKGTKCQVTDSAYYMPNGEEDCWIAGCIMIKRKPGVRKK